MTPVRLLHHLLGAFSYNRDDEGLELICLELIDRFNRKDCVYTDEGDIIYSTMIMAFGNYGTSPRTGWFEDNETPKLCIEYLQHYLLQLGGDQ